MQRRHKQSHSHSCALGPTYYTNIEHVFVKTLRTFAKLLQILGMTGNRPAPGDTETCKFIQFHRGCREGLLSGDR